MELKRQMTQISLIIPTILVIFLCTFFQCKRNQPEQLTPGQSERQNRTLRLGLIPEINIFEQKQRYQPLVNFISAKTRIPITISINQSYHRIIEELEKENIELAFLGSMDYAVCHSISKNNTALCSVIARPLWKNRVSTYAGSIFTLEQNKINADVRSWKNKKIALVHKLTTAGYIYPRYYLQTNGVKNFEQYFKQVIYTGSHDAALQALLNGEADLAACKNHVVNRFIANNPNEGPHIKILATSPEVPSNGMIISSTVTAENKQLLKNVLINLHADEEGRKILSEFGAEKFISTDDSDYKNLDQMLKTIGETARSIYKTSTKAN